MREENRGVEGQGIGKTPARGTRLIPDCLFLAAAEILSLVAYAPRIGFYTDDWAFLSIFKSCHNQSFAGLYACLYTGAPDTQPRPVQIFSLTALYKVAGVHPFAYQLFIAFFLVATVLMLYFVLRELQAPRLLALSLPLLYGLLPHYSTDRFWMASSQSFVSMFFGLLCYYCVLRSASASRASRWRWQAGSIVALLLSAFAYEIFVPLFVLVPFLYWYRSRKLPRQESSSRRGIRRSSVLYFLGAALVLVAVTAYKMMTQFSSVHGRFLRRIPQVIHHGLIQAIDFNYGYYGLGLPAVAWNAVRFYLSTEVLVLAAILACAILAYFHYVVRSSDPCFPRPGIWARLLGLGLVIYGLGYAPFFAYPVLNLTSTDPENRIALAAAVGAAISMVSLLGLISSFAKSNLIRTRIFTALVTIFAVSGFLIVNAIGCFWATAYQRQNTIVASIRERFPVLPQGSVLILDGVCPSIGPAPVFEFDYDLAGTLRIDYDNPDLRADVVSPVMKVGEHGLTSVTYGYVDHYAYGRNLIVFNPKEKVIERLTSAEVARQYFRLHDPDLNGGCSPARLSPAVYSFKKSGFVKGVCSNQRGAR